MTQQLKYEVIEGTISSLRVQPANVHFLKRIKQEKELASAVALGQAVAGQAVAGQAGAVLSAQAAMDEGDPVESFSMAVSGETTTGSFWKVTFKEGDEIKAIGSRQSGLFRSAAIIAPKKNYLDPAS